LSWPWWEERAKKFSDWPACICFSCALASAPVFCAGARRRCRRWCLRRCLDCIHGRESDIWCRARLLGGLRRMRWHVHDELCSKTWRSHIGRPILAGWLPCEKLCNAKANCAGCRNPCKSNCPPCETLSMTVFGVSVPSIDLAAYQCQLFGRRYELISRNSGIGLHF